MMSFPGANPEHDAGKPAPSLMDRTIAGFIWTFTRTGARVLLQLGVLVVLARLLTPHDFGVVTAASVIIGFSLIISQLGIGPAIVQHPALNEKHTRTGFTLSVALGLVFGALVFLVAPWIAQFFRLPELTTLTRVMSLLFPIGTLGVVGQALLQRRMDFRRLAAIDVGSYAAGYGAVAITLAALGFGVWALVIAQIVQATLQTASYIVLTRKEFGAGLDRNAAAELLSYSFGFILARVGNYFAQQGDLLVAGRWLGAIDLGVYSRAYQLLMMPANLFGTVVDVVLFPALANVQGDSRRLKRAYMQSIATVAMITFPLSGLAIVMAPELILVLMGHRWMALVGPFQILVTTLVFRTSYKMSDSLTRAVGAVYRRAWRQWIYAIAVFLAAFAGKGWGISGIAVGVSFAITLNFVLMLQLSLVLTGLSYREVTLMHLRHALMGVIVAVVCLPVALASRAVAGVGVISLVASCAAGLFAYLAIWRFAPSFLGEEAKFVLSIAEKHLHLSRFTVSRAFRHSA